MKYQSCFNAIEKLNEENLQLRNSSEMAIGKTVKALLSMNFKRIYVCFRNVLKNKFIKPKLVKNKKIRNVPFFYANGDVLDMGKKVVVYTCITQGYDTVKEPFLYDDALDYYLITENNFSDKSIWKHMDLPNETANLKGGMVNRYCKLNPFALFPFYDFAIYIDGTVEIMSDIRNLCTLARDSKIGMAMHLHNRRDCIYNESLVCKLYNRGNFDAIKKQMEKYRQEGFPEHFGMVEATIIIVDLKNPIAKKIMSDWWNELVSSGCGRDQLSFPYVLWKNGYCISDVGCLGTDRIKNPKFRTKLHHS